MELLNRKAIITGACGGFGRELSLTFAKEGADIALVDIKKPGHPGETLRMGEVR